MESNESLILQYVGCQVGGLYTFKEANRDGCYNDTGSVLVIPHGDQTNTFSLTYEYDIREDNDNDRTLQSLSTRADKEMKACDVCPYHEDFQLFLNYYGDADYANRWIMGASYRRQTNFKTGMGEADFSTFEYKPALAEAMSKGAVSMSVLMYVIGRFEDAIHECDKTCSINQCDDGPVHSLDEAVAFYAGSLQGKDGSGDGRFLYEFADRMAIDFRTAGEDMDDDVGTSFVNLQIFDNFKKAQLALLQGYCNVAQDHKRAVVNLMKVPLVQSILKIADHREKRDSAVTENSEKIEAEGATYAAALLPWLYQCNKNDAQILYENMRIGSSASKVRFSEVKTALERNYDCLGITCQQVGGIWTVNGYASGAEPCGNWNTSASSAGGKAGVIAGATIAVVCAVVLLGFLALRLKRAKQHRRRMAQTKRQRSGNIAAVTEIS